MSTPRRFFRDKDQAKLAGVCAGIGNYFGIDALWVRIGTVILTLLGGFPWTLIAYVIATGRAPAKSEAY